MTTRRSHLPLFSRIPSSAVSSSIDSTVQEIAEPHPEGPVANSKGCASFLVSLFSSRRKVHPLDSVALSDRRRSDIGGQRETAAASAPRRPAEVVSRWSRSKAAESIAIPLNQREIFTIVKSWQTVHKEFTQTGMRMFLRMFETNPTVKSTFEKFRQIDTPSELWKSSVLYTHGLVVMNTLEEIILNLDDEEGVTELMLEQGRSHARFGDELNEQIFWAIEEPFLLAVKEAMLDRYTPKLEQLYKKTIHYILTVVSFGFRQSKKRQPLPRSHRPRILESTSATVPKTSSQRQSAVPQPPQPRTSRRSS